MELKEELDLIKDYKVNKNIKSKEILMNYYVEYLQGLTLSKYGQKYLLSEAYIVLDDILEHKYDYTKGVRLITYAYPYIINRLNELVNDLPYSNGILKKVKNRRKDFIHKYGYEPTNEELSEEYNISLSTIESALKVLNRKSIQLDENIDFEDTPTEKSHLLSIPNGVLTSEEKHYLETYLTLNKITDIYKVLGITFKKNSELYNSIVTKLKKYYKKGEDE